MFDDLSIDPVSIAIGIGIGFLLANLMMSLVQPKAVLVNPAIEKDNPKVSTSCTVKDIEDLVNNSKKGKVSYCRCWRSTKFPYCDGAHREYNERCGDNTGPLTITKGEK